MYPPPNWVCADGVEMGVILPIESMARFIEIFKHTNRNYGFKTKTIVTSGGYDPIHPGHISVFRDSKHPTMPISLIVLVNGDDFLIRKKGYAFMPQNVRCEIVAAIEGVDYVVPFNPSNSADMTVCEALEILKPHAFAKGGDRTGPENIPEWEVCEAEGIEIITGLGDDKVWSSSNFLSDYKDFILKEYGVLK